MAIRLMSLFKERLEMKLTKTPISNPQQSPEPTGVALNSLDPVTQKVKREQILNHPNYSENEVVYLKPGMNIFENEEHAEYLYRELGNPEDGGVIPIGAGQFRNVKNKNKVLEVNEKGEELKDNLFLKYRQPVGAQVYTTVNEKLFVLTPEVKTA